MDWSKYIDTFGEGWMYDRKSGHQDDDSDSPKGTQYGVMMVPVDFAEQAEAMFPDDVEELDEADLTVFVETRFAHGQPVHIVDDKVVAAINARIAAGATLTPVEQDALDPEKDEPGVRKNPNKSYTDLKAKRNSPL